MENGSGGGKLVENQGYVQRSQKHNYREQDPNDEQANGLFFEQIIKSLEQKENQVRQSEGESEDTFDLVDPSLVSLFVVRNKLAEELEGNDHPRNGAGELKSQFCGFRRENPQCKDQFGSKENLVQIVHVFCQ